MSALRLGMESKAHGKYVDIRGRYPCHHPDFAHRLVDERIVSISLNPDGGIEAQTLPRDLRHMMRRETRDR
jgi:hypothetical protein